MPLSGLLSLSLKVLLIALDLLATLVTFGWIRALKKYLSHKGLRTVPVGDDESHRVDPRFKNHLLKSTREDITTLYDLTNDSFKRYASRHCMGTRQFLGWKSPKMKHFGGVTWKSYAEVDVDAHSFGAALRVAGLVPASGRTTLEELQTPCSLAIFEDACAEWLIAALGAFSQSIIVTTVSNSLGIDGVVNAVNAGSIAAIVVNKIHVKQLMDNSIKMPSLKIIIYTSNLVGPKANIKVPDSANKVQIVEFQDFVASGGTTKILPTPPLASTSALIMYKANAAGKGIVITHGNMVAACASGAFALGIREEEDSYISYLPPSLCIELVMELIMISRGCTICYAEPKSLTKTGSYPEGALTQFAPTVMMGFPRTWGAFMKRIQERMHQASPFGQFLVQAAMEARSFALNHGYDTPLFKALVFDKLKQVFGGKLRLAIAAPGPLWGGIRDFIHTCFGIPLIKIYGLTEACAICGVQEQDDFRYGNQGVVIPSMEIKLVSFPELKDVAGQPMLSTDRFDVLGNPILGRGEFYVKGANVAAGYYMRPDETKEMIDQDGWLRTGHIGRFMPDGTISIVYRKKNLVKLKGGDYIALEIMEGVYIHSAFVDRICCYGDGDMDRAVALIEPNQAHTMKWAKEHGISGDFETVKESKEFFGAVMEDVENLFKKAFLRPLEQLQAVAFVTTPESLNQGWLTASNQLQRQAVLQMFERELVALKGKGILA